MSSCYDQCWKKPGAREYKALTKIDEPSNVQLIRSFADYSIDKQIDIFLYAKDCPNDPRFEPILSRGGVKIVPTIVGRIETEEKVWDKGHLVSVLTRINAECKCISSDSDVVKRLEAVARALDEDKNIPEDYTYKRMYKDEVNFLKRQTENRD